MGQLKELRLLSLVDNRFTGILPKELIYLSRLTNLDISGNNFEGIIPNELVGTISGL
jgi:LRR receptor-like serine/threonine-protein kinase EFR